MVAAMLGTRREPFCTTSWMLRSDDGVVERTVAPGGTGAVASASCGSNATPRPAATRVSTAIALSVSSSMFGVTPTASQAARR